MSAAEIDERDSPAAWRRMAAGAALATIGGIGNWSFVVVLPAVQADLGLDRATASIPYTAAMVAFAFGGVFMGRIADRVGIIPPLVASIAALGIGYVLAALAPNIWGLAAAYALIGFVGSSVIFGPMMADISHWFVRNRGIAVAIVASGNYLAGALWPPLIERIVTTWGWRTSHVVIAIVCVVAMTPLAFALRRRTRIDHPITAATAISDPVRGLGLSPNALMLLVALAGFACCMAMAMPQVHLVAYCADLGYGPARGAEMLALMLGLGVISRIGSGWLADRIGGLPTLLVGSAAQALALALYTQFDSLTSLFVISALFGLFQGGIVPSYAIVVREYFSPREAGERVGIVLMATIFGMAAGGWVSGLIFDMTGSYIAAFAHGFVWNLLNTAIVIFLLTRHLGRRRLATA